MSQELSPATKSALDFTSCDRERIHEISMVQAYGALVVVSFPELKVRHLSRNLPALLGASSEPGEHVGARLDTLFEVELVTEILQRLRSSRPGPRHHFEYRGRRELDVFLFPMAEDLVGIEVCPLPANAARADGGSFDAFVKAAKACTSVESLCQLACETVRRITGLDRVMMYRFFPPSWYGEVIAEDRVAESHSFRDHRFPASDIPRPARELYLRNQVRLIVDSAGEDATFVPAPTRPLEKPLDLSDSRLRSVSRVHLEYLKNMGVRASFSVSVTVNNDLWGLISCHGSQPHYVTHAVRAICENVAHTVALFAPVVEANQGQREEIDFTRGLQNLFESLRLSPEPREELLRSLERVLKLFDARGLALVEGRNVDFAGLTPLRADILEIAEVVRKRMEADGKDIFAIEQLAELSPRWAALKDQASGLLAVRSPETGDTLFLLFRPELVHTVKWGGDPRGKVESRNYQGQVNPRVSFETWTETIRNTSAPWKPHEVQGATYFRNMIFDSLIRRERIIQELGGLRNPASK